MRLPKDKNDQVLLGTGFLLAGLGLVVGASLFPRRPLSRSIRP